MSPASEDNSNYRSQTLMSSDLPPVTPVFCWHTLSLESDIPLFLFFLFISLSWKHKLQLCECEKAGCMYAGSVLFEHFYINQGIVWIDR